jgi:hypothetical protein
MDAIASILKFAGRVNPDNWSDTIVDIVDMAMIAARKTPGKNVMLGTFPVLVGGKPFEISAEISDTVPSSIGAEYVSNPIGTPEILISLEAFDHTGKVKDEGALKVSVEHEFIHFVQSCKSKLGKGAGTLVSLDQDQFVGLLSEVKDFLKSTPISTHNIRSLKFNKKFGDILRKYNVDVNDNEIHILLEKLPDHVALDDADKQILDLLGKDRKSFERLLSSGASKKIQSVISRMRSEGLDDDEIRSRQKEFRAILTTATPAQTLAIVNALLELNKIQSPDRSIKMVDKLVQRETSALEKAYHNEQRELGAFTHEIIRELEQAGVKPGSKFDINTSEKYRIIEKSLTPYSKKKLYREVYRHFA